MSATKDRSVLHAYLSDDAHSAWQKLAEDNGVSVTGLLEQLGLDIADEIESNSGEGDGVRGDLVKAARKIDAARRRRNGA